MGIVALGATLHILRTSNEPSQASVRYTFLRQLPFVNRGFSTPHAVTYNNCRPRNATQDLHFPTPIRRAKLSNSVLAPPE